MALGWWAEDEVEGLAPPLKCLIEIQSAIQNGETVRNGLVRYLEWTQARCDENPFSSDVRKFLFAWDQGQDWKQVVRRSQTSHRRALLELMAVGLGGQPVQTHLEELRLEIVEACDADIQKHLEMLPVLMLAPLLLLQFPAFLLLLFGPLLNRLIEELSR
jgi:hypothetical protein